MNSTRDGFITEDFLLHSDVAQRLYHEHAAKMPIFDFHCHLPPRQIAEDKRFENLADIWLRGDHYKWRAMRTNGVAEELITGAADDRAKFQAWAETVPYTIGNPLYHWTHLELREPFGIDDKVLNGESAQEIWDRTRVLLSNPSFSARGILQHMNVRAVFTTDDPVDSLQYHRALLEEQNDQSAAHDEGEPQGRLGTHVRPSFRPDKALAIEKTHEFNEYLDRLGEVTGTDIRSFESLCDALLRRIEYFHENGCRVSDHALVVPVAVTDAESSADTIFKAARAGGRVAPTQAETFRTALLLFLGREYARRTWVMQLHIGALRNNNTRMFERLGPDSGFDSMGDDPIARRLTGFLDLLDVTDDLPRTIIYILNPRDNELIASTIGDFQDGSVPGKVQFGPAWWFNDQKYGMESQMRALANMGLLSRFVGMLTDSRSFLSYPRHEYFRRILCDMLGSWVVRGEAPRDLKLLGGMVEDICWHNAVRYFGMEELV